MGSESTHASLTDHHALELDPPAERADDTASTHAVAVAVRRGIHRAAPGRIRGLCVQRQGDAIVLTGTCPSFYCKQLAQTAAMETALGWRIDNRIEVH